MRSNFINRTTQLTLTVTMVCVAMSSCTAAPEADANGNFEAVEVLVSADCNGRLLEFNIEEGSSLRCGEIVGWIDTMQLVYQRDELKAQIAVLRAQLPEKDKQLDVTREQLAKVQHEIKRYKALVQADASTAQVLDNMEYDARVLDNQIAAESSTLDIQTRTLLAQMQPLRERILAVQDRIDNAYVVNPIQGRVLAKYAEQHELAAIGKPLYKIANLDTLILRAYVEEPQLSSIKLGQRVRVEIDSLGHSGSSSMSGTIGWIADKAEFTPKVIQTKSERANLVYAIKIYVPNSGVLKIGMPAGVFF